MKKILILLLLISLAPTARSKKETEKNQVKAVVFYKQGCCGELFTEFFPTLKKKHGRRLRLLAVNTAMPDGAKLYLNALLKFKLPLSRNLPLLIAGRDYFSGPALIKKNFPPFIERNIGGVDWPDIPRLQKTLEEIKNNPESRLGKQLGAKSSYGGLSFKENALKNFRLDPVGHILAAAMELLMIFSLFAAARLFFKKPSQTATIFSPRLIPFLSVIGLLIASYLSVVKMTGGEAVCGPIGDCESVQNSSYADLFGVIPVSVLGMLCFLFILALWFSRHFTPMNYKKYSISAIRIILMAGLGFFIYLTYLEIFIIGAVCLWCLASAAMMTLQLWASTAEE